MQLKKTIIICVVFVLALNIQELSAQFNVRDSIVGYSMIGGSYTYQVPGGDMADRFGNNSNIGAVFQWKTRKNWIYGIEGGYMFSDAVNENTILSNITTSQGYIIGQDGYYAEVYLYERGFSVNAKAGKIFPVIGPNPNSGLMATLGIGLLQHKIHIEDKGNRAPQLSEEYKKGYDRLSNGLSLTEYIGYTHFGDRRLINFSAGFEFTQAFTQNRRDYNYDTMMHDDKSRIDLLFGAKITWIIPLYKRMPREFYYD